MTQEEKQILKEFVESVTEGLVNLPESLPEAHNLINDNFWEMVD